MKLIYLSPVPWESIAQRPHFFVKEALKCGFDSILWVEPTPSRLPNVYDFRRLCGNKNTKSFDKPNNVTVIGASWIPVEPFGKFFDIINAKSIRQISRQVEEFLDDDECALVIGKPSRLALQLNRDFAFSHTVMDVMDDFPAFFTGMSSNSIKNLNSALLKKTDMAIFSSSTLRDKYASNTKKHALILNACDSEFISKCSKAKNASITKSNTFGYIGSIADWFDWDLVKDLALQNSGDKVVIIGPLHGKKIPKLPKNVEIRQPISHDKVAAILKTFDYGIIPFKNNDLTHFVDPVKYYEYLAAGIEVISSRFGQMSERIDSNQVLSFDNYMLEVDTSKEEVASWSDRFTPVLKVMLGKV